MSSFHLKRIWLVTVTLVGLVTICSITIHPFGRPKQSKIDRSDSLENLGFTPQVTGLIKRSCADCHSNETSWPWYSYVAPVSWLVEADVHRGREHMNLSMWDQYTFEEKTKLLADVATVAKNAEMPLPQYVLLHRNAKLSTADTDLLYNWARTERRRMKTLLQTSSRR